VLLQKWVTKNLPLGVLDAQEMIIRQAIEMIPTRRHEMVQPWSKPMTICFFCAFGIHRSRSLKNIMAQRLMTYPNMKVEVFPNTISDPAQIVLTKKKES